MILNYKTFGKQDKGGKLLCAHGKASKHNPILAAYFALRNTKSCGDEKSGKSEGGQFLPSRQQREQSVGILLLIA